MNIQSWKKDSSVHRVKEHEVTLHGITSWSCDENDCPETAHLKFTMDGRLYDMMINRSEGKSLIAGILEIYSKKAFK